MYSAYTNPRLNLQQPAPKKASLPPGKDKECQGLAAKETASPQQGSHYIPFTSLAPEPDAASSAGTTDNLRLLSYSGTAATAKVEPLEGGHDFFFLNKKDDYNTCPINYLRKSQQPG